MRMRTLGWAVMVGVLCWSAVTSAEAGGLGRAIVRGATRSLPKGLRGSAAGAWRAHVQRDHLAPLRPVPKDRTVFRYTSKDRAAQELRKGIPQDRHMTSQGGPGRPLSAEHAQKRYGLDRAPEVRETIRVPAGTPMRANRAVKGERGIGERTAPARIPPEQIEKVVPVR